MSKFEEMVNSVGDKDFYQDTKDFFGSIGNWFKNAYKDTTDFFSGKNETAKEITNTINNGIEDITGFKADEEVRKRNGLPTKEEIEKTTEESPNKDENEDLLKEIFGKSEEMLKNYWNREDAIRKETQDREDTAYQRTIQDMLKAGINPNLINVQPASAGGGITNASRIEETGSAQINMLTQEIVQEISNNVKIEENQKSRLSEIIKSVVTALIFKKL